MTQAEADFAADEVFGVALPWERIDIANLHTFGGKPFVFPHGDTILVNMGDFWEENFNETGQLFIHELTHAWQVEHASSSFGGWVTCGVLNQVFGSKTEPSSTDDWNTLKAGQQAVVVDHWYARHKGHGLAHPDALADPFFPFIRDHIRNPG